jgi:hypothetical protein
MGSSSADLCGAPEFLIWVFKTGAPIEEFAFENEWKNAWLQLTIPIYFDNLVSI